MLSLVRSFSDFVIEPYVQLDRLNAHLVPVTHAVSFAIPWAASLQITAPVLCTLAEGFDDDAYVGRFVLYVTRDGVVPQQVFVSREELRVQPVQLGAAATLAASCVATTPGTYRVQILGRAEFASFSLRTSGAVNVAATRQ